MAIWSRQIIVNIFIFVQHFIHVGAISSVKVVLTIEESGDNLQVYLTNFGYHHHLSLVHLVIIIHGIYTNIDPIRDLYVLMSVWHVTDTTLNVKFMRPLRTRISWQRACVRTPENACRVVGLIVSTTTSDLILINWMVPKNRMTYSCLSCQEYLPV